MYITRHNTAYDMADVDLAISESTATAQGFVTNFWETRRGRYLSDPSYARLPHPATVPHIKILVPAKT